MIKPMLAKSGPVPTGSDWRMERKYDGWRLVWEHDRFYTRTGKPMDSLPYIDNLLGRFDGILDGEIVDLNAPMGAEWNRTQTLCSRDRMHDPYTDGPPLVYVVFDVLEDFGGVNVRDKSWTYRRNTLEKILTEIPQYLDHHNGGEQCITVSPVMPASNEGYEALVEQGAEGVVVKHVDALYEEGKRSKKWIKVKPKQTVEAVVTGTYEPTEGSKYDGIAVGGMTFRVTYSDGDTFDGRCAGMDDALRSELYCEPEYFIGHVIEVEHGGISEDGTLRFPRFKRFRDDKINPVEDK